MQSKINVQKSYWRLKDYTISSGDVQNATAVVKLKKLFSHIKKFYDINLLKAFYSIVRAGKSGSDNMNVSKIAHDRYDMRESIALPMQESADLISLSRAAISDIE